MLESGIAQGARADALPRGLGEVRPRQETRAVIGVGPKVGSHAAREVFHEPHELAQGLTGVEMLFGKRAEGFLPNASGVFDDARKHRVDDR